MSFYLTRGTFTSQAYSGGIFADPFEDIASTVMPTNMSQIFKTCERILYADGTTRQALDRVLSYFLTDIEIYDASDQEKEDYQTFLEEKLGIKPSLRIVGMDYLCYGNSFISILMPFTRYLSCKSCHYEAPLRQIHDNPVYKFKWNTFQFFARCPSCKYTGEWDKIDRRSDSDGEITIKRWSPQEIELIWDPFSGNVSYIWKIPEYYKRLIREGRLEHLAPANWEVVEAIRDNMDLKFEKDVIYHLKEDTLAGILNRGWGIPRLLANFRQIWQVQAFRRFNEAIALDYVIPFRVITPAPAGGGGGDPAVKDPINNMNLGGFVQRVGSMLRLRRRDPAAWHVLPWPVQYQTLGGDAKQLAPRELLDQGYDILLNNLGVPVELYKGSITLQAAPTALRLFESNWNHLVYNLNRVLDFIMRRLAVLLSWQPAKAKLQRVTHADDLNRQLAKLNLMAQGLISETTGLKAIGLDKREETLRQLDDERFKAESQQKFVEDMEAAGLMSQMMQGQQPVDPNTQAAAGGGGEAGVMPPAYQSIVAQLPTGPNQKISPDELLTRAQTVAQQLMSLPESQKDSELIRLKRVDQTLHSVVKAVMDDIRQQARTSGGAMVLAQQFGRA